MTPRAWTTQFSIYMRKVFQTKKVRPYLTNFDYVNVLKHSTQRKFHQPGFPDDRELNLEANDLVEIGQNSDEWKDAMDKFVSAKMYNERLLDFVAYATTAPLTFTLENSLCAYFKCKSVQRNEDGTLRYRGSSLRSWLSVFAMFWQFCRATSDLKKSLPAIENMIRKLESGEIEVKRAKTFEKEDLIRYYGLSHTLENLVDKAYTVIAISFAARGCEVTFLTCEDVKRTEDKKTGEIIYTVSHTRAKTSGVPTKVTSYISGLHEVAILEEYERCFKQNTRNGRYFRVLGYNTDNVTWRVTNKVLGKNTTAAAPKRIAIALLLEHPHLYTGHAFRRTSATLCAESGMSLAEIKLVTGNGIRKLI